ncbi:hypothetical protein KKC45_02330 [Patescibacteria group bacterium]|nr:hypothetical protein [Patescibacteria group bacterium]
MTNHIIDLKQIPERFMQEVSNLLFRMAEFKENCEHGWDKVMKYDPNYSPRVDEGGIGEEIIDHFFCEKCRSRKELEGLPFTICRKCGGIMKLDHRERYDTEIVYINKCQDCGHEYDTT